MNRVWMVVSVIVFIKNLTNMKLLYNGSDNNSGLLYVYNWIMLEDIIK